MRGQHRTQPWRSPAKKHTISTQAFGWNFFPLSTLINSNKCEQLLRRGQQIVIIGDRDDAATQALVDRVWQTTKPFFAGPNIERHRHTG